MKSRMLLDLLRKTLGFDSEEFGRRHVVVDAVGCGGPIDQISAALKRDVRSVGCWQNDECFIRGKRVWSDFEGGKGRGVGGSRCKSVFEHNRRGSGDNQRRVVDKCISEFRGVLEHAGGSFPDLNLGASWV